MVAMVSGRCPETLEVTLASRTWDFLIEEVSVTGKRIDYTAIVLFVLKPVATMQAKNVLYRVFAHQQSFFNR